RLRDREEDGPGAPVRARADAGGLPHLRPRLNPARGSPLARRLRDEAVADAAHGQQVPGVGRVVLDVTSEADDEVVYGARVGVLVQVPDLFEYLPARDGAARVGDEVAQKLGLHQSQTHDAPAGPQLQRAEVNRLPAERVLLRFGARL